MTNFFSTGRWFRIWIFEFFCSESPKDLLKIQWSLQWLHSEFPEITLGDIPKIINFQKYPTSIEFHHYGFCFHKSRSVTSPNGLGFCFRKTRPVTFPDFCWCSTLCLIILQWWRHKHDNLPCTYTPTGDLSVTYDVTVQMSLVTSLVTKKKFWILFPKITVGDIPEMLSIKVKYRVRGKNQTSVKLSVPYGMRHINLEVILRLNNWAFWIINFMQFVGTCFLHNIEIFY